MYAMLSRTAVLVGDALPSDGLIATEVLGHLIVMVENPAFFEMMTNAPRYSNRAIKPWPSR
jgi:hypothetical protein